MPNICIGIPSYIPDSQKDRVQRIERLNRLIKQLDELFALPIIFIAQNWKDYTPKYSGKLHVFREDKLGILKARQLLRTKFLELGYDYIIMFDDDAIIQIDRQERISEYLNKLAENPNGFCFIPGNDPNGYADSQLNLCAISKYIYSNVELPNVNPQNAEGFEDRIFSCLLHNVYSEHEFIPPAGIRCIHFKNANEPVVSTWAQERQYNWQYMRKRTQKIEEYIRENKKLPDLRHFYSKDFFENEGIITEFNKNTKFMQLWGDCSGLGYLGDLRLRGPVDNVYSVKPANIKLLLDNKYYEHIINTTPNEYPRKKSFAGDVGRTYDYGTVKIIHNIPTTDAYRKVLAERINAFNNFYENLKHNNNYYFTVNLNNEIVNPETNTFRNEEYLKEIISILAQYNILHKTIFVGLKQKIRKDTSNMFVKNFSQNYQYLNYIEIEDNDVWDTTKTHLQFITKVKNILDKVDKIDLVVPYVDSSDPEWINSFNQYNDTTKVLEAVNAPNRFRGQGNFFRFFFRGLEKNMPWLNNVYLLVQSESQVPTWINRDKVKVILHEQFIPKEYLPTYNSCTIELFLWNIPGLSEKFIYTNDDFYSYSKVSPNDFYSDNLVRSNILVHLFAPGAALYDHHCRNSYVAVNKGSNFAGYYLPGHTMRPYLKSALIRCFNECKEDILNSISRFRSEKNINCYIYNNYLYREKLLTRSNLTYKYIGSKCTPTQLSVLNGFHVVCLNDDRVDTDLYKDKFVNLIFYHHFPTKSKYELSDFEFVKTINGQEPAAKSTAAPAPAPHKKPQTTDSVKKVPSKYTENEDNKWWY